MQSFLRNCCTLILILSITFFVLKCGSSTDTRQEVSASESKTYKNLDSNVKYVGITACKQCHYDKYETFIETGMGKSFDKANKTKSSAKFSHDRSGKK